MQYFTKKQAVGGNIRNVTTLLLHGTKDSHDNETIEATKLYKDNWPNICRQNNFSQKQSLDRRLKHSQEKM